MSFIWDVFILEIDIHLRLTGVRSHSGSFVFRFEQRPWLFKPATRLLKRACECYWAQ